MTPKSESGMMALALHLSGQGQYVDQNWIKYATSLAPVG